MVRKGSPLCSTSLPPFCNASCALTIALLILSLAVTSADARRRGHHHGYGFSSHFVPLVDPRTRSYALGRLDGRRFGRRNVEDNSAFDRHDAHRRSGNRDDVLALVPPNWHEQPSAPNWQGYRFVSPEGDAWIEFYSRPTDADARDQHLRSVAFVDGEELTYLRRERDRLVVSGFKGENGERMFFRKVVLACDGRHWGHVALEYPAQAKRALDRSVASISKAVDAAADASCGDATVGSGGRGRQ